MRGATIAALIGALAGGGCTSVGTPGANTGTLVNSEAASGAGEAPVGAIEGIFLGADIGRSLDESDRELAVKAEYEALEYGRAGLPSNWSNPRSGNSGKVVASAPYQINKLECRQYTHTVSIGGRTRVASGVACRQPGGTWRMIS